MRFRNLFFNEILDFYVFYGFSKWDLKRFTNSIEINNKSKPF